MAILYTASILFLLEWCIRQLCSPSITSPNITSTTHNHHTDSSYFKTYKNINIKIASISLSSAAGKAEAAKAVKSAKQMYLQKAMRRAREIVQECISNKAFIASGYNMRKNVLLNEMLAGELRGVIEVREYCSILVVSYSTSSGALDSSDLLLSYPTMPIVSCNANSITYNHYTDISPPMNIHIYTHDTEIYLKSLKFDLAVDHAELALETATSIGSGHGGSSTRYLAFLLAKTHFEAGSFDDCWVREYGGKVKIRCIELWLYGYITVLLLCCHISH